MQLLNNNKWMEPKANVWLLRICDEDHLFIKEVKVLIWILKKTVSQGEKYFSLYGDTFFILSKKNLQILDLGTHVHRGIKYSKTFQYSCNCNTMLFYSYRLEPVNPLKSKETNQAGTTKKKNLRACKPKDLIKSQ